MQGSHDSREFFRRKARKNAGYDDEKWEEKERIREVDRKEKEEKRRRRRMEA